MRLVDDDDDPPVALGLFGFEELTRLGHDLGLVEARAATEGPDDRHVQAPGAEGRVGDVDEGVTGGVE
jgi:hypothetical protein